jgi:flagella basal body P-ring formation protein FlgA
MRALLALTLCAALAAAPAAPAADDGIVLPAVDRVQNDALAYAEAQAAGMSGSYSFRVLKVPNRPRTADPARFRFEHPRLSQRDLGGHFFVSFQASVDGRPVGMVRVDLEGKWTGKLLRTLDGLPRKSVPEPAQFELVAFDGTPPAGALTTLPAGYRLRAPVSSGHILLMQDLETIPVVVAGDQVRVEVVNGALTIAVEAVARSNGALGEKVRLEMPSGRKNLQAVVTGPGEARVQWAGN